MPMATALRRWVCARSITVLHKRHVDLVGAAVGDEFAVELEFGEGQFAELRQRRIAGAEFVDGEPHIVRLQPLAELGGKREIGNDLLPRACR